MPFFNFIDPIPACAGMTKRGVFKSVILKKNGANSPPVEGWPQAGVVFLIRTYSHPLTPEWAPSPTNGGGHLILCFIFLFLKTEQVLIRGIGNYLNSAL